jgi:integrase
VASVCKHPQSKYWVAVFYDSTGRQRRRSTRTTDRRLAERLAAEFEKASRTKRTLAQLEKVLRSFHEELGGQGFEKRSLSAFCQEWLEEKEPSVSDSTKKFYRKTVQKLLEYFGDRAEQPITEITPSDLVRFRNTLAEQAGPSTVNHDLVAIRMLFKAARRLGRLSEDPAEFLAPIRELDDPTQEKRRPFSIAELQRLLAVADDEWKSMIKFGLYTGSRLGDVATLRWDTIDLQRGELRYAAKKTRKSVLLPIVGPLATHIENLPSSDEPHGFLHPRAAETFLRHNISAPLSNQFAALLELAGLRDLQTPGPSNRRRTNALSFHSLRHTAVSLLKDAGIPMAVVLEIVGHSDAQTNALYTHVGIEQLRRAASVFPPL